VIEKMIEALQNKMKPDKCLKVKIKIGEMIEEVEEREVEVVDPHLEDVKEEEMIEEKEMIEEEGMIEEEAEEMKVEMKGEEEMIEMIGEEAEEMRVEVEIGMEVEIEMKVEVEIEMEEEMEEEMIEVVEEENQWMITIQEFSLVVSQVMKMMLMLEESLRNMVR